MPILRGDYSWGVCLHTTSSSISLPVGFGISEVSNHQWNFMGLPPPFSTDFISLTEVEGAIQWVLVLTLEHPGTSLKYG